MSSRTSPLPFSLICCAVGSVVMPASMPPFSSAAMKVAPAPAATVVYLSGVAPTLPVRYWVRKSVEDPGLVIPSFLPGRSLTDAMPEDFPTISTSPGTLANCTTEVMHFPLVCRSMVWS
jgi:hypothetical protein